MTNIHALIVEDDINSAEILAAFLQAGGVSSTIALDGAQFFDVLGELQQLNMIFLDLEMPGVDGYQIFDALQKDKNLRHIPVIATTVHISEIANIRRIGFHSFIGKPLRRDLFPNQLARILRNESVWEID